MPHTWNRFIGETIAGGYVVTGFLGEERGAGLFGTDRPEAVVRIAPEESGEADRLAQSWAVAANLTLPNVVRVFETGRATFDDVAVVFAVSERPEDNVAGALATRRLSEDEVREVLESIVPALEVLHARSIVHGHIDPDSIVAAGNRIKLTSETLAKATSPAAFSSDVADLGKAVLEMLTGDRAADEEVMERLPSPFGEIVRGTTNRLPGQQWSLGDVQDALAGRPVRPRRAAVPMAAPASPSPTTPSRLMPAVVGITLAALLIIAWLAFRKPGETAPPQTAHAPATAVPSPAREPEPTAKPSPVEQTDERTRMATVRSGWAVVAAAYRDYDRAEQRARSIRTKWSQTAVHVWPAKGSGRHYLVMIGSGLTKEEAERLRQRARSAGLPRDTYVTKITGGA